MRIVEYLNKYLLIIVMIVAVTLSSVISYNIGAASGKNPSLGYISEYVSSINKSSYADVVKFVSSDKTNDSKYIKYVFNCVDFARITKENANKMGIRCAIVIIVYSTMNVHTINAFDTYDGVIYFEPQDDLFIDGLAVNKEYVELLEEARVRRGGYIKSANDELFESSKISKIDVVW